MIKIPHKAEPSGYRQNSKRVRNFELRISNLFRVWAKARPSPTADGLGRARPYRGFEFRVFRPGFTLIEIIVYIAVLAVISVMAVDTFIVVNSSLSKIRAIRSLNGASIVAMERMTRVIREAKSVDVAGSLFDLSAGILSLNDSVSPATTHRFSVSSNRLKYKPGAEAEIDLTPPGVSVGGIVFRFINFSTTSQSVKIELTLAVSSGRATTTQSFYDTVVLRNSYSQ